MQLLFPKRVFWSHFLKDLWFLEFRISVGHQKMSPKKDSFKDRIENHYNNWPVEFFQQRLNAFRPQWTARNLKSLFLTFGMIFAAITIPLWIIASEVFSCSFLNHRHTTKWYSMMDIKIEIIHVILMRIMQTKNVQYAQVLHLNVDWIYVN